MVARGSQPPGEIAESADLARKRAPAFYGESEMTVADAARALQSAERVLAWASGLLAGTTPAR